MLDVIKSIHNWYTDAPGFVVVVVVVEKWKGGGRLLRQSRVWEKILKCGSGSPGASGVIEVTWENGKSVS